HLGREAKFGPENGSVAPSPAGTLDFNMLDGHQPRPEPIHCDLLHHARRRWKDKLPDCKLQTLERYVCRRRRTADIPGREIPSAYHDFVRSGDAWLIRAVLHHNALDLVTLLQLSMLLLPATHSGPRKGQDERRPDQVK
ncbi:MAG: ribonuclease H-like domain-containing protein, partial [Planctomycetota bacterium]